jgi:integrase
MGSVISRGTRSKPKYYVKYKDTDGRWKMRLSKQPTKDQARKYLAQVEARVARGKIGIEEQVVVPLAGKLMEDWAETLINRNARDDRGRLKKHLLPKFRKYQIKNIMMPVLLNWIDEQRRKKEPKTKKRLLADGSIRHNLNLLSRFFSWAVEHGHAVFNPVKQIPQGKRPQQAQKRDIPWLKDDALVRKLMNDLQEPVDLMFYLGNRSGLRTGEIVALRMADMGYLVDGIIRVRFSYDGPLKEDKKGTGKMKWVPAADDAEAVLGPWLAMREAAGAGPEDLVFPCANRHGSWYRKEFLESRWEAVAPEHGVELTWYQATRHTFTSRALEGGATLDEVSAALGHSSPVVTRRYYDHFVRRSFSSELRRGLGIKARKKSSGEVVSMRRAKDAREERAAANEKKVEVKRRKT